jgi:hypothetical protein
LLPLHEDAAARCACSRLPWIIVWPPPQTSARRLAGGDLLPVGHGTSRAGPSVCSMNTREPARWTRYSNRRTHDGEE